MPISLGKYANYGMIQHMKRALIPLLIAASLPHFAQAGPETETLVRETVARMEQTSGDALAQIIVDQIDVSRMAGYVLGAYGQDLPTADRVAFEERFETFMVTVLAERAWNLAGSDISVVGSVDRRGVESIVTTRLKDRATPSQMMRWRLIRDGNSWKIIDLQLGGLWLAVEQRAQVEIAMNYDNVEIGDLYDMSGGGQDELLSASTRNTGGGQRVISFLNRVLP